MSRIFLDTLETVADRNVNLNLNHLAYLLSAHYFCAFSILSGNRKWLKEEMSLTVVFGLLIEMRKALVDEILKS